MTPLTPRSSALPSPIRGELPSTSDPQDTIVRSLADWERKQELLERQSVRAQCYDFDFSDWLKRYYRSHCCILVVQTNSLFVILCQRGGAQRAWSGDRGKTTGAVTSARRMRA